VIGFNREPSGFKPEKSALGVSCGGGDAAFTPEANAREEAAAALCRNFRRVVAE
jgi:hypothetical protein